jgi:CheY-like chemotaxis protein
VDLLILDLVMPGTDGFEVARVLRGRKLTADLPIVAVTSVFKKEDFPSGPKAQGFDAIIEKAASPDQLMFTFNKYLHADQGSRPAPRLATFLPAVLRCKDGREVRGAITNLSRSGAFVSTATLLEEGSAISLSFALPEGPNVRVRARVLRLNDWDTSARNSYSRGMGVLFDDVDENTARAIDDFVQREVEGEDP